MAMVFTLLGGVALIILGMDGFPSAAGLILLALGGMMVGVVVTHLLAGAR